MKTGSLIHSSLSRGSSRLALRSSRRLVAALTACLIGGATGPATEMAAQAPAAPSNVKVLSDATVPGPDPSWIQIVPGTSIQNLVNQYPGATTFYLRAGVHRRQQVRPKTDNRFIGEEGAVMDGENVTPYAFETLGSTVDRVHISRLVIRNYASPTQQGAIQGDNGRYWIVEDSAVHNNLVIGIRTGPGWQVLRNKVYRNGTIGISGFRANGTLIEANEVYENNHLQAPEQPILAEASGMKFLRGLNMVIRNNHVHHNYAKGIWIDGNYPTTIVEGNRVTDNLHAGIWIEVSFGAVVRRNVAERNGPQNAPGSLVGHAGIQVTNSPDVEIAENLVVDNSNGIGVMQSAAPTADPTYGVLEVRNLHVHGNEVRMRIGRTGLVQIINDKSYYTSKNNRFQNNTYRLGTNATYFAWSDQSLNETQWKAAGNDVNGVFTR